MATNFAALLDGLRFSVLLAPGQRRALPGPGAFWIAAFASVVIDIALNYFLIATPEEFFIEGLSSSALQLIKPLLIGWALSLLAGRPPLIWGLSTWLLLVGMLARVVLGLLVAREPEFDDTWIVFEHPEFVIGSGIWLWLAGCRIWHALEPQWAWHRVIAFALAGALTLALALQAIPYQLDYFYGPDEEYEPADTLTESAWPEDLYIEDLFAEQSARLDRALDALKPQRPGKVDLYFLSVGGYASEDVFRNEVEYAQALFDQRFDTAGRSIALLNHVDTLDDLPLATQSNIDRALAGIAERIDQDEDIVFLFVTTHGSDDHELAIDLMGLPLQQVTPESLAAAIRQAGIRWRVAVISACYSGGYIDALSSSTALVLTAARSDRTSFGCGADSDITYFGRAYFAEALNQTGDFLAAFEIAKDAIAARELEIEQTPSEPQVASNPMIEAKLAEWLAQQKLGPKLPFDEAEAADE
jgi:Peptidase C13 family